MKRLSGVDAAFLYMETPTTHMHIVGVIMLDPNTVAGGYSYERFKKMLRQRIHRMPPFFRRLKFVPFGLEHPYWVNDANFTLESHIRRIGVPSPGTKKELGEIVGEIAGRPLDRSRPLWELWVVEGMDDGSVALVTKMHHSAVDGMAGGYLMLQLLDFTPDIPDLDAVPLPIDADEMPSDGAIVRQALKDRLKTPGRFVGQARRTIRRAAGLAQETVSRGTDNFQPTMPFSAPRVGFSRAITSHRNVSFGSARLADFKRIKSIFGCTVNDVVLAACTESLRRYLLNHEDLPDRALVASCPVSVRTAEQQKEYGNRVSSLFVRLPVHIENPVEQLRTIAHDTRDAKAVHRAMGADMLQDWAELAAPRAFTAAARMYSRMKLADRHRPIHNLVVSNVPGPQFPLYCLGASVTEFFPLGPVMEGAGLNITVVSHMGDMDIGVIACTEIVPDLEQISDGFSDAVASLLAAAERAAS